MSNRSDDPVSRRRFLTYLAASPVVALGGYEIASLRRRISGTPREQGRALAMLQDITRIGGVQQPKGIGAASQALDVFDF